MSLAKRACCYGSCDLTVARFLREKVGLRGIYQTASQLTRTPPAAPPGAAPIANTRPIIAPVSNSRFGGIGYSFGGRFVACRNGREVLVSVFEALAKRDLTFLDRFAARPKHGRTRRYLARSPEELYPGRPDLARQHFFKLESGWCIRTNVSHAQIERTIEMACEVSKVRYGKELIVNVAE